MMGKILVVDQDHWMSRLTDGLLQKLTDGWEASFSQDAAEAITVAERGETDVIVVNTVVNWTDMPVIGFSGMDRIPEMHRNGVKALLTIRDRNPNQRVIVLTSPSTKEDEVVSYCETHGAEAVLVKPFEPAELAELILQSQTV